MSTFWQPTKHPVTGEWHNAVWMDDYFRHGHYAAGFADGLLVDPYESRLKTDHRIDGDKLPEAKSEDFYPKTRHVKKWENKRFEYWTTADGERVKVTHLQHDHLAAILRDGYRNPVLLREAKKRGIKF